MRKRRQKWTQSFYSPYLKPTFTYEYPLQESGHIQENINCASHFEMDWSVQERLIEKKNILNYIFTTKYRAILICQVLFALT